VLFGDADVAGAGLAAATTAGAGGASTGWAIVDSADVLVAAMTGFGGMAATFRGCTLGLTAGFTIFWVGCDCGLTGSA